MGLIGPNAQVQSVKNALEIGQSIIQMDETEGLYSLDLKELVVPDNLRSGRVTARRVEQTDVELLAEWNIAYEIEALGAEDGPALRARCRKESERHTAEKRQWVLEDGGKPVACSAFNTRITEAVQVGGVWTPPEFRGRGYARAVVAASLLDARAAGAGKGILFTGEENLAAQKAYASLGFHRMGDYRLLLLRSPIKMSRK
jgi:predicted GNAT family acetyltransferase